MTGGRAREKKNKLTGNGAAYLSPARADTSTVPDHTIFGSLVSFPHTIGLLVDLVIASFFSYDTNKTHNV